MSCKTNSACDFCDARCAHYYEETEDCIVTYKQMHMPNGTYEYCKVIYYKFPQYNKNGERILYEIIAPEE